MDVAKVALKPADSLIQVVRLDLEKDVIPLYTRLLRSGRVSGAVIAEETHGVILSGHELYEALILLGAEKVPVIEVKPGDVNFTSKAGLSVGDVIEAGVTGKRLPKGAFSVEIETTTSVEVGLEELGVWRKADKLSLRVYNNTLELLYMGWPTPLVRLVSLSTDRRQVWAKLECYNPFSNSVKDRIGWSMIKEAMDEGRLKVLLYEATSTNTGMALTSIANMLGKRVKLFIPTSIQKASDVLLGVLGAEVVRIPVSLTIEALEEIDRRAKEDGAVHLNQFENDANLKVHLKHTARELDEQLKSVGLRPTHIIGGLGTSGHMSAISLYFKSRYGESVKVIGVQPAQGESIPGIRRVETGMKWYHWAEFDELVDVTRDEAIEGAIKIARKDGLLVGLSAGAVVSALTKIANEDGIYVLVFPDSGYKYVEQFGEYFSRRHNSR